MLEDPAAGVLLVLPETAHGYRVPTGEAFSSLVSYSPNETLIYLRVMDVQALFLPLKDRLDEIGMILTEEMGGFLPTYVLATNVPGSDQAACLYGGRDREGNGVAGFALYHGRTGLLFFGLSGPAIQETDAGEVMGKLYSGLRLTPRDMELEEIRAIFRHALDSGFMAGGDYRARMDAAEGIFNMRHADCGNYQKAIYMILGLLFEMKEEGVEMPMLRARAVAVLDTIGYVLRSDQLKARREFAYALGTRDVALARRIATFLDGLDSALDPGAAARSERRWRRVREIQ